jgi:hypothetical protein
MKELAFKSPNSDKVNTGELKVGVPFQFGFTTPAAVHEKGKGSRLQVTSPVGYNGDVVVTLGKVQRNLGGTQPSAHVEFGDGKDHVALEPNTLYEGTVVAFGSDVTAGVDLQLYVRREAKPPKPPKP